MQLAEDGRCLDGQHSCDQVEVGTDLDALKPPAERGIERSDSAVDRVHAGHHVHVVGEVPRVRQLHAPATWYVEGLREAAGRVDAGQRHRKGATVRGPGGVGGPVLGVHEGDELAEDARHVAAVELVDEQHAGRHRSLPGFGDARGEVQQPAQARLELQRRRRLVWPQPQDELLVGVALVERHPLVCHGSGKGSAAVTVDHGLAWFVGSKTTTGGPAAPGAGPDSSSRSCDMACVLPVPGGP